MLKSDIRQFEYVVFDIETTGFNSKTDQIIEIGAVKVDGSGNIIDKFQQFVKLYKVDILPSKIVELTNITDNMLKEEGKDISIVMQNFYDFFKNSILVAQNAKFDMSFIDEYYLGEQRIFLENLTLDTIDLAKNIYPSKGSYKLAKLVEYFEVVYNEDTHHRADYDATLTAEIFIKGMKYQFNDKKRINLEDYLNVFNIVEASINQKRYLYKLLVDANIKLENKIYLSKNNAMRQISILTSKE